MNATLFIYLILLASASSAAHHDATCRTSTSCWCSTKAPRDCYTPTSETGKCIKSNCDDNYNCDCTGYETCQLSKCPAWKPTLDNPTSDMGTVDCTQQGKRECIKPTGVVQTASAAGRALLDAKMYAKSSSAQFVKMTLALEDLVGAFNAMGGKTRKVEEKGRKQELEAVYKQVDLVHVAVGLIMENVMDGWKLVDEIEKGVREANLWYKRAKAAERKLEDLKNYAKGDAIETGQTDERLKEVAMDASKRSINSVLMVIEWALQVAGKLNMVEEIQTEAAAAWERFLEIVDKLGL